MKKFCSIIILVLIFAVTSCTHNNGDIGPLFGQWIMTDITADGQSISDVTPTDWNWRFQNQVILISQVDNVAHTHNEYWGSWSQSGKTITVNYRNTDPSINFNYDIPKAIGFTEAAVYQIEIITGSASQMTLQMVNPQGVNYVYTLTKHN